MPAPLQQPDDPLAEADVVVFVGYGRGNWVEVEHDWVDWGKRTRVPITKEGTRKELDSFVSSFGSGQAMIYDGKANPVPYDPVYQFVIGSLTNKDGNFDRGDSGGGIFRKRSGGGYELVGVASSNALRRDAGGSVCVRLDAVSRHLPRE
jgi:hypothetical protein